MKWLISRYKTFGTMIWWMWNFRETEHIVLTERARHAEELRKQREFHKECLNWKDLEHQRKLVPLVHAVEIRDVLDAIGIDLSEKVEDIQVCNQSVSRGCYSCDVSYRQGDMETGFHLVSVSHWEDYPIESSAPELDQSGQWNSERPACG